MRMRVMMRGAAQAVIVALTGLTASSGVAQTQEVLSMSNNPGIQFDARITDLLTNEKTMLGKLDAGRLQRLSKLPPGQVVLARPDGIQYSRAYLDTLPAPAETEAWKCLTEALYFEARGETVAGQFAVAEVILNRVERREWPDTVCDVVNQGTGRKHACQFSYTCDGKAETVDDLRAHERVGKVAAIMLGGAERLLTQGATHYHTLAVEPYWAAAFARTTTIGEHHFYFMR
ncbi:MAG: cell wall hydrolase [Pseudomonadota bacterium]